MTKSALDDLLRVKKLREQAAERALRDAEAARDALRREADERERAAEAFRDWRVTEEARLFDEIRGQEIHVRHLDDFKRKKELLRVDEAAKFEEASAARTKAEEAEKPVDAARQALVEAQRAVRKFEEFVAIERQRIAAEEVARMEAETEEVAEAGFAAKMAGGGV